MSRQNKRQQSVAPHPETSNRSVSDVGVITPVMPFQPSPQDLFKGLFEKALDAATRLLPAAGPVTPMVVFVYGNALERITMQAVFMRWKNESHKEAVRRTIQEKAAQEGATAVVLLLPAQAARLQPGTLSITGVAPRMAAEASVTYTFEKETRTFTFSEFAWRDTPAPNFFLGGLFPTQ